MWLMVNDDGKRVTISIFSGRSAKLELDRLIHSCGIRFLVPASISRQEISTCCWVPLHLAYRMLCLTIWMCQFLRARCLYREWWNFVSQVRELSLLDSRWSNVYAELSTTSGLTFGFFLLGLMAFNDQMPHLCWLWCVFVFCRVLAK